MAKNMAIQTLKHAKSAEELQEHLKNMTDEDLQSFYDGAKKIPEDQAYKYEKQFEIVEEYMVERGLIKPQKVAPAPQSEMAKGAAVFNKARAVISSGEELELPDDELELLRSYLERMHESLVDHTVENYIAEHFPATEITNLSDAQEQDVATQKSEATLQMQENQQSDNSTTENSTVVEKGNIAPTNVVPENITPTPLPQEQTQNFQQEQEAQAQPQQQATTKPLSRGEELLQQMMTSDWHDRDILLNRLSTSTQDLFELHKHIIELEPKKGQKADNNLIKQRRAIRRAADEIIRKRARTDLRSVRNSGLLDLDFAKADSVRLLRDILKDHPNELETGLSLEAMITVSAINKRRQEKGKSDISLQIAYYERGKEDKRSYQQWLFDRLYDETIGAPKAPTPDELAEILKKYGINDLRSFRSKKNFAQFISAHADDKEKSDQFLTILNKEIGHRQPQQVQEQHSMNAEPAQEEPTTSEPVNQEPEPVVQNESVEQKPAEQESQSANAESVVQELEPTEQKPQSEEERIKALYDHIAEVGWHEMPYQERLDISNRDLLMLVKYAKIQRENARGTENYDNLNGTYMDLYMQGIIRLKKSDYENNQFVELGSSAKEEDLLFLKDYIDTVFDDYPTGKDADDYLAFVAAVNAKRVENGLSTSLEEEFAKLDNQNNNEIQEQQVQEQQNVNAEQEPVVQEPEPVVQEQEPVAQKFEYEDITKDNIYNLLFEEPETIKQALDAYTPESLVAFRTWIQEYIDDEHIVATAPQLETFYSIAVERIVKEPRFAEPDKLENPEKAEIKILLETYSVDFNGKPLDSKSEYKGPYDSLMVAYGAQLSSDAPSAPTPEVQITEEDKESYQALSTMAKDAFDFLSNDRDDLNKRINNLDRFFDNVEITHDEEWRRVGTVAGVKIWDSYTADDLKANVHEMASQQAVLEVLQEYTPDGNDTYISQADGKLIFASDMQEIMREKVLDHMEAQTKGLISAQMQKEFADEMLADIRAQYTADNMPTEQQLQQELQQQIQAKTEDLFNETTNDLTAGFWGRMKDRLSSLADDGEDDDGETIIRNRRLPISDSIAFSTIKATSDQNAEDIKQVQQAAPKDSKMSALVALLAQRNKDSDKKLAKNHEVLNAIYASAKGFLLSAGVAKLSVITGQPWIMSVYIGYNSAKAINGLYKEYKQYNKVTNKNFRQFWRENPVRVTTTVVSPFLLACGFSEARIANAAAAGITSALSEWKKGNKGVAIVQGLSAFAGVMVGMHGANAQENSATSEDTESNLTNHNITPEVQTQDVANTENYTQNINTSDETTSSLTSENVSTDTPTTEQTSIAQSDTSQKVEQQTVQNAETAQEEAARQAQEEAARQAQEEAARQAQEEAARQAQEEAEIARIKEAVKFEVPDLSEHNVPSDDASSSTHIEVPTYEPQAPHPPAINNSQTLFINDQALGEIDLKQGENGFSIHFRSDIEERNYTMMMVEDETGAKHCVVQQADGSMRYMTPAEESKFMYAVDRICTEQNHNIDYDRDMLNRIHQQPTIQSREEEAFYNSDAYKQFENAKEAIATQEAPATVIVNEVKVETPATATPIAEEVKVETPAPATPVAEEVKVEAPAVPIAEEVKVEAPAAPIAEEVKVETPAPATPVAEEVKVDSSLHPQENRETVSHDSSFSDNSSAKPFIIEKILDEQTYQPIQATILQTDNGFSGTDRDMQGHEVRSWHIYLDDKGLRHATITDSTGTHRMSDEQVTSFMFRTIDFRDENAFTLADEICSAKDAPLNNESTLAPAEQTTQLPTLLHQDEHTTVNYSENGGFSIVKDGVTTTISEQNGQIICQATDANGQTHIITDQKEIGNIFKELGKYTSDDMETQRLLMWDKQSTAFTENIASRLNVGDEFKTPYAPSDAQTATEQHGVTASAMPSKELYASALSNAIEFGLEDAQTITVSDGPEKGYLVSKAENGWQVMKPDGNSVVLVKDENGAWKGSFVSSQGDVKDMSPKEVTNYRASAEGTFKSFHKVDTRGRP